MIAKYNNNVYIANLRDKHIVLVTYQKEKATEGFKQKRNYYKKEMKLDIKGIRTGKIRRRKCFVYIMHEERKIGVPSLSYVSTCLQGYVSFGFDEHYLSEAQIKAVEVARYEE